MSIHFVEVMEQIHGYDYKADLWSLGITALELAKGYAPYAKYPPMKVLILTIQEDPPSLETYDYDEADEDDEEDDYPQEWTPGFTQIISRLLQKNPAQRPTCHELLQSPLLLSNSGGAQQQQKLLESQICSIVQDVGAVMSSQRVPSAEADRPAGTTWVFSEGSQVLSSSSTRQDDTEDVIRELDQFCGETGGENYKKEQAEQQQQQQQGVAVVEHMDELLGEFESRKVERKAEEDNDLDDFLDEFEKTTAGENFQRPV
jgi:serine/threonine-protein kinase OSR1/STK39